MDALIYRYNSIYEPSVIDTFTKFGINCIEELSGIAARGENKNRIEVISNHILSHIDKGEPLLFVFSINFFPDVSEVCEKLNTLYVCWSVDCPVLELFSNSLKNKHNRIFLFDYAQYMRFSPYNPECIFYLPLATEDKRWDKVISSIDKHDIAKYSSDISFIGSLYTEKNPMDKVKLSGFDKGYVDGLLNVQEQIYGSFFLEKCLSPELVSKIVTFKPVDILTGFVEPVERYMAANDFLGVQLTVNERNHVLSALSERFKVDLYTQSDPSTVPRVNFKGSAKTLTEMPKIFNLSKINLNITMRPISTGIPLRIFDVLGCGGFLITNYQEELFEHFEVGTDLEVYSSIDELVEKCDYYLSHEDERKQIALNGYNKIKQLHTIEIRMSQLLSYIVN